MAHALGSVGEEATSGVTGSCPICRPHGKRSAINDSIEALAFKI